jgi:Mn2+/Fe2+ NRAMP family transporter
LSRLQSGLARMRSIGPGIVMAATGIGASDFFTGIWAGSQAGRGVLWAVIFGAILKYYLTEGIARKQILTGKSFIHLWMSEGHALLRYPLPVYFAVWSVCVFSLLLGATGLAASQFLPLLFESQRATVAIYGIGQGAIVIGLLSFRGYSRFETIVHVLVGATAATILYSLLSVRDRAFVFEAPAFRAEDTMVVLAILTGIGGTLTLLGYGSWIRAKGYNSKEHLPVMRLDCMSGYVITAVMMTAMILLSDSTLRVQGIVADSEGAAKKVFQVLGDSLSGLPLGKHIFAAGFWCIVISSMVGVWQSVPHIFAEGAAAFRGKDADPNADASPVYRVYRLVVFLCAAMLMMFEIPVLFLLYAIVSALFMPFLAANLLYWNNLRVPSEFRNSWIANMVLAIGFALFLFIGIKEILRATGVL